jgi:uncharacterized protein
VIVVSNSGVVARLAEGSMLTIDILPLDPGLHHVEIQSTAEDAGLDPDVFRDVRVDVRLDRGEDRIYVSFTAEAVAHLECDRTLQMFDLTVSGQHGLVFLPEDEAEGDEESDHVKVLHPDDEQLDITNAVRDTLLLAIPQRKIAPGAENVEIPTRFGDIDTDDIADPRWEALRKLRDSNE